MVRQLEAANTVLTQNAAAEAASRAKESRNLYVQYSRQEMETATRGYSEVLGEGGFGVVYKGCLRGTQVAIKKLNPEGLQGSEEFKREVGILSRLRHQNIVILMGCCPEDFCLVYEYCAHGSLEDRLKDEARALPWYTRLRIALEFAKALLYMHKSGVLHSDLKPANLLLDENLTAKLGDFGISQVMPEFRTRTLSHMRTITASGRSRSHSGALRIQGSFGYMDPAIFGGGEFSEASDVYALGICLLQLLTNRPAVNVTRDVLEKYYRKEMGSLVDHRAGEWPAEVIEDLTNIALQSTNSGQSERPDLETEVIPLLERLHTIGKTAEMQDLERMREAAREAERRRGPQAEPTSMKEFVEMHFLCPISQEVMDVPVMAADGHTYERSMIAQWLTHRMTSPVTNQRMAHMDLVENHIVRSAIRQWRESSGGDGEG
jgi:serine/threonine protein kinase